MQLHHAYVKLYAYKRYAYVYGVCMQNEVHVCINMYAHAHANYKSDAYNIFLSCECVHVVVRDC